MAQLADAEDSKSSVRKDVRVRSPLRAPPSSDDRKPGRPAAARPVTSGSVVDPAALSKPVVRRLRRMVLLAAAIAAVVLARDKIIGDVEQREGDRLGLGDG